MMKAIRSSDVWVIAGLAVVVCSAKLASGTLPGISEWVSGLTSGSSAEVSKEGGTGEEDSPPIVIESPNSLSAQAPIIVLPQLDEQSAQCPVTKHAG
jgi:hypothetical protein